MISRATRLALSAGLTLFLGFAIVPLGCAGSVAEFDPAVPVQADAELPEEVALQIRKCAAEHRAHLGSAQHFMAFDVKLESDGEVDSVALRGSTIRDEELEVCMAKALRSLTEDALPMRSERSGSRGPVAPGSRALLGNPAAPAAACLFTPPCALTVLVIAGAAYIALTVYVHAVSHPRPNHHPGPVVTAAPTTTVAPPVVTAAPMATATPTATAVPTAVPTVVPTTPKEEKETCGEKHPKLIRCDDPKISSYPYRSEDGAFNAIVKKLGKGVRKAKARDEASGGPCKGRGGFHTNVLQGGGSAASIVGCDCCDDSSGKAIKKQRADIVYKW